MPNNFRLNLPPFPPVVKNLIIINFIVWVAESFISPGVTNMMDNVLSLHSTYSGLFKPWQIFTYMFMHSPFDGSINGIGTWHILLNMFVLWMFGSALEINLGSKRFLTFYLISGIGAALIYLIYLYFQLMPAVTDFKLLQAQHVFNDMYQLDYAEINSSMLGASGAISGVVAIFSYLFPNTVLLLSFIIPVKAKWAMLIFVGYELFATVHHFEGDNVGHVAHLGGALTGFLLIYFSNRRNRKRFY